MARFGCSRTIALQSFHASVAACIVFLALLLCPSPLTTFLPLANPPEGSLALQVKEPRRVMVFYHITAVNNWREIVEAQISRIVFSGLYDRTTTILCGLTAPSSETLAEAEQFVTGYGKKFQIVAQGVNSTDFERLTMHQIDKYTVATDAILYFHSKGVSSKHQNPTAQLEKSHWRFIMEYWLMKHHQRCIDALAHYDVVGTEYRLAGKGIKNRPDLEWSDHFAGNFWWTTGKHWKSLPPVVGPERLDPEMHLFNKKYIKAACLGGTDVVVGTEDKYNSYPPGLTVDALASVHRCKS